MSCDGSAEHRHHKNWSNRYSYVQVYVHVISALVKDARGLPSMLVWRVGTRYVDPGVGDVKSAHSSAIFNHLHFVN